MTPTKKKSERGNALLEFALSWSVLWALFAGVYQFGYAFYEYNVLLTSVSNAAQLGSKLTYDVANPGNYTTALTNMVLYGSTTQGTTVAVPGLASSNVSVNVNTVGTIPTDVTVSINNFSLNAVFTTFNFNGKPRVTAVYMGQIACTGC